MSGSPPPGLNPSTEAPNHSLPPWKINMIFSVNIQLVFSYQKNLSWIREDVQIWLENLKMKPWGKKSAMSKPFLTTQYQQSISNPRFGPVIGKIVFIIWKTCKKWNTSNPDSSNQLHRTHLTKEFDRGIGSLFDTPVNSLGQWPFWWSYKEVSYIVPLALARSFNAICTQHRCHKFYHMQ